MAPDALTTELFDEICKIPCINSHSHLISEAERLEEPGDALTFFDHAYPGADLVAAGMSDEEKQQALKSGLPLAERWKIFAPYWRWVRATGYTQGIMEGIRDLYGIEELNEDTIEPITEAMQALYKPGFYRQVLQDRCNLELSVLNMEDLQEVDRELFLPLPRLNRFSMLRSAGQIDAIEKDYNVSVGDLDGYIEVIRQVCQQWDQARVAGVKMSQSYHRRMDFTERKREDAAPIFDRLRRGEEFDLESPEGVLLEDYIVFECCRAAMDANLTVQFHQGMRAGNFGSMEGCSPAPLAELFKTFRQVRFDLSHSGYPYLREGAVLAKTFSNVYLDMSWIHIISPVGTQVDLKEWIRMVPYNKIIAYGDDVRHVEAVYGHLKIARQNFATVLAQTIQEGAISESVALDIARAAFRDNPARIYRVDE